MNTAEQVLVIIVSSLLSISLILSIAMLVMVIKLVKIIRRIADKGEQVIENTEHAAEMFGRAAKPMGLFRSIANIIEAVNKHKKGR
jgi:hypothetical protein